MYRQSEIKRKMAEEHCYAVKRVGSYPVVISALSQVSSLYGRAKEGNRLVKYTLESAECVTKKVSDTAVPLVANKLEGKLDSLNSLACSQLDKLEEKYPIITKPTDEVITETKNAYEHTVFLKPTVDKVTAVTKYGINTVSGVKTYTCDTVKNVKDYSTSTVINVKDYGVGKVILVKDYGVQKVNVGLNTPLGQKVATKLDGAMDVIEVYVDHYLPAEEAEEKQDVGNEKIDTLMHAAQLSNKLRKRMYSRAMNDLSNMRRRSTETMSKLNFTVDLIQYAKSNLDSGVEAATHKFHDIYEEINRDISEEEEQKLVNEDKTLERRVIRTVRQLTLQLKQGLDMGKETAHALPETLTTQLELARKYSEDLYVSFKQVAHYDDLSQNFMENVQNKMVYMQSALGQLTDMIVGTWPVNKFTGTGESPKVITAGKPVELEMQPIG